MSVAAGVTGGFAGDGLLIPDDIAVLFFCITSRVAVLSARVSSLGATTATVGILVAFVRPAMLMATRPNHCPSHRNGGGVDVRRRLAPRRQPSRHDMIALKRAPEKVASRNHSSARARGTRA